MRFSFSSFAPGLLVVVLTLGGVGVSHADDALKRVQQSLREQGFYYGTIDGTPGDETTQAIRRYQIRNGLAVTGQLTDETRASIARTGAASGGANTASRGGGAASVPGVPVAPSTRPPSNNAAPIVPVVPAPRTSAPVARNRDAEVDEPDYRLAPRQTVQPPVNAGRGSASRNEEDDDEDDAEPAPPSYRGGSGSSGRPDLRAYPSQTDGGGSAPSSRYGTAPSASLTALFERTPYEFAPPAVQADIVRRVQIYLNRSGYYDGPLTGNPGLRTTEAIANFQGVNRLRPTARLDVSTLGLMRLLPGRQTVEPQYDHPRRPRIIFEGRITE